MQVVVGLGSPFLSDDGVGPQVVRRLRQRGFAEASLVEAHAGGLLLLEELSGADRAVIVDALLDTRRRPGEVVVAGTVAATRNAACSHDCSLAEALTLGRGMGLHLPDDEAIHLVGIVAADVSTFSEQLTPAVARALDEACDTICALFGDHRHSPAGRIHV